MDEPTFILPSGTRLMCIQDCVEITTREVLYKERHNYVTFDNMTIVAENGMRISLLQSDVNVFMRFFIPLTD